MNNNIDLNLIFKALSDPIRIEILKKISTTESICVCELTNIANLSQSKLSYHLKLLLSANLINKIPKGKWNFYSINKDILESVLTSDAINKIFL
jgi:ArsR family transcriptional regulator